MTQLAYGLLTILGLLQVLRQKTLVLRNICVIVSTYRQRKSFSKVFRFHENLQPDGFSVKLKREKKAQTQVVIVKYVCLTFLYQLLLDT